ncbi:MAG: hypothetical protein V1820_03345 [archaeon]
MSDLILPDPREEAARKYLEVGGETALNPIGETLNDYLGSFGICSSDAQTIADGHSQIDKKYPVSVVVELTKRADQKRCEDSTLAPWGALTLDEKLKETMASYLLLDAYAAKQRHKANASAKSPPAYSEVATLKG